MFFVELLEEVRERWDGFVVGVLLDVNKRNIVESVKKIKLIFLLVKKNKIGFFYLEFRYLLIVKYDLFVILYN